MGINLNSDILVIPATIGTEYDEITQTRMKVLKMNETREMRVIQTDGDEMGETGRGGHTVTKVAEHPVKREPGTLVNLIRIMTNSDTPGIWWMLYYTTTKAPNQMKSVTIGTDHELSDMSEIICFDAESTKALIYTP